MPSGKKLVTLRNAADYITSLPKKESDLPGWQTAIEALMLVSTLMERIAVMKALNRHVERVFNLDRKDTHWGKRKLKRRMSPREGDPARGKLRPSSGAPCGDEALLLFQATCRP